MASRTYSSQTLVREVVLLLSAVVYAVPLYLLVTIPFKTSDELFLSPLTFPKGLNLQSFHDAWIESGQAGLGHAMISSFLITIGSVALLVLVGAMAAYTVSRRPGKTGSLIYFLFLLGFLIPIQLAIIPLYSTFNQIGLVGNIGGMVLLYTGMLMPMSVFFYTGFLRSLPRDYEEAARVDGASELMIFFKIVFPLMSSVTGTVAILTGVVVWNDFFVSLIFLSGSGNETLPVAVFSFVGEYSSQWNKIFAAVLMSIAPMILFYVFAQKQLIRGFSGGVKG